ncbi:MAG: anti-phage deoxyguanosine triphosphatase [Pseudomonadota bacterium]
MSDQEAFWDKRRSGANPKHKQDSRDEPERDVARLIHSAAFRRLQGKTQILGIGESDFHRTRLTHSMEVAQIGRGIVCHLIKKDDPAIVNDLPSQNTIVAICLAHDLGHPPFGHGGETALNCLMSNAGGFEGNAQTLRLLTKEEAHTENYGLDLTRRTLLGILKYPVNYSKVNKKQKQTESWKPPKCYYDCEQDVVNWIIEPFSNKDRKAFQKFKPPSDDEHGKPTEKSLDASIMELADDIAYGVHDLEDAIHLEMISVHDWDRTDPTINKEWEKEYGLENLRIDLFSGESSKRKRAVGAMVNALISSTVLKECDFKEPKLKRLIVLKKEARDFLNDLQGLVREVVIDSAAVQTLEYRGQQIIKKLFEAFISDPKRLLKRNFSQKWQEADCDFDKARIICDYLSGMTDEYATRMFERLFVPRQGTVLLKL